MDKKLEAILTTAAEAIKEEVKQRISPMIEKLPEVLFQDGSKQCARRGLVLLDPNSRTKRIGPDDYFVHPYVILDAEGIFRCEVYSCDPNDGYAAIQRPKLETKQEHMLDYITFGQQAIGQLEKISAIANTVITI